MSQTDFLEVAHARSFTAAALPKIFRCSDTKTSLGSQYFRCTVLAFLPAVSFESVSQSVSTLFHVEISRTYARSVFLVWRSAFEVRTFVRSFVRPKSSDPIRSTKDGRNAEERNEASDVFLSISLHARFTLTCAQTRKKLGIGD